MKTTIGLTQKNRRVIQQMQRKDQLYALLPFLAGILLVAYPCLLLIPHFTEPFIDIEPVLMFLAFVVIGIFIGRRGQLKARKIDDLYASALNGEKLVVSGLLKRVAVVGKQYVSYTLDNYFVQAYIPLATYQSKSYKYRRELATIETLVNVQVSLHIVTIKPDVIILLEAVYASAVHETSVLTPEQAESDSRVRIRTMVCEVLEAWIVAGRLPRLLTWYRLGNGMMVQFNGQYKCGDILTIEHIERENGEWGEPVKRDAINRRLTF